MRAVGMDQNPFVVVAVVGVAADVHPPVNQQHALSGLRRQALRENASREPRADD